MSDFLTDRDVAERLGISWQRVQARCRAKEWPHTRIGKKYRFTPEQYERIKAGLSVEPTATATPAGKPGRSNPFGAISRRSAA